MPFKHYIFFILSICITQSVAGHNGIIYVENKGQWESKILFQAKISNGELYLEKNCLTFHLWDTKKVSDLYHGTYTINSKMDTTIQCHAYQLELLNANLNAKIIPQKKEDEYFNYFIGSDQSKWAGGCKGFEEIIYQDIYKNIDLKVYALGNSLKYDFILKKGANIKDIQVKYRGLDSVIINKQREVLSFHSLGIVKELEPYTYLKNDDQEQKLPSNYTLTKNILGFDIPNSPKIKSNETIVIDPTMIFSCFSGSTADNFGSTATYDEAGNLFGAGTVFAAGYPTTLGAYQVTVNAGTSFNNPDIGITKFSSNGSTRIYSTYLGGTSCDQPHSLICDKNDRLIVFSTTSSSNYPTTTNGYDKTFNGGPAITLAGLGTSYANGIDMAITKFNPQGTGIINSTYLGGNGTDGINNSALLKVNYGDQVRGEVLLDSNDNVYIVSTTNSSDFPTTLGAFDQTINGGFDGCIVKFNPTLSALQFSSFIGGSGDDAIYSIALDKNDVPVFAGGTSSPNFPTFNAFDNSYNGNVDGFITKLKATGDSIVSSTYYGTPQYDQIYFVELTRKDTIHVFGQTTNNTNYFRFNSAFGQNNSGQFVSKFSLLPNQLTWSTLIGKGDLNPDISPTAFLVDFCGKIYLSGWGSFSTFSGLNSFPLTTTGLTTTPGAFQTTTTGNDFYLMVLDDNASKLDYATFYGGAVSQEHVDGGTSRFDKNGVMYHAVCAGCGGNSDLPIRPIGGPVVSQTNNSSNCNLGVFKFDFGLPVVADFSANTGCAPTNITFTNLSHSIDSNATFFWDFGDGQTSAAKNPVHFYTLPGLYTVKLILFDTLSCNSRDTIFKKVLVLQNGKNTSLPDKVICPGGTIRIGLDNVKDPNITIKWVPTIGLDDTTILTPFATPPATTTYKLYIMKNGCTDTFTQRVVYKQPDKIKLTGDTIVCINSNTVISATLFPKGTYQWFPTNLIMSSTGNSVTVRVPANNTKYYLLYRDSLGCVQTDSINVRLLEPLIDLIADTLICKNANVLIQCTNNLPEVTYVWKPAVDLVSNLGSSAIFKVSKPQYFYLDAIDNSGCIVRDSIFINTVENIFKINVDTLICKGDTIQINTIFNAQFVYSWTPASKIISGINTFNPFVKVDGTTLFIVDILDNSGCIFKDTVGIRTIDQIFSLSGDTLTCQGDTVKITCTSNPQFTYQWKPISKIITGGNTNVVNMKIDYSGYYYIDVRDNSGCLFKDSIKINTIEHVFDIFADTFVCIGDTTTISSTNNPQLTLQWKPLSNIISGATSNILKVLVDTTRFFTVDITDHLGCKTKDSIKISTVENSFSLIYVDTFICLGDTFQIIAPADPDFTYQWAPASEIVSGQNTPNPKIKVDKKKQIYLLVKDISGCEARDTVEFTPIQNRLFLTTDTTKCDNDTLKVQTLFDAQFKYAWSPSSGIISGGSTHQPVFNLKKSQFIQLVITDNSGCKVKDSIYVNIRKTKIDFIADTFICPNDTITIQAPFFAGATYAWTPLNKIISGGTSFAATISTAKNTFFYVTINDTLYCKLNDSIQVRIIDNENLNFIQQDTSWCNGDTIQLQVTEIPGVNYNWNPNQYIISGNNSARPKALIKQNTRFVVAITDIKKGCKAADTIDIKIDTNSIKIKGKTTVCFGDLTELKANHVAKAIYSWTPIDWLINRDTFVSYAKKTDQKYKLSVVILPDKECIYADSITVVSRNELLDLKTSITKDTFFYSDTFQLTAFAKNAISYVWDFDTTLSNLKIRNPLAKAYASHWYYVNVEDFYNCKNRDSIEIFVKIEICDEPEVYIPNAFTPNGDGKNDVFYIRGDNITESNLTIFDRWGQTVFESIDKNIGWDGTFKGTLLEPTVYAYYAKVRCIGGATYIKKGNVTLIR